MSGRQDTASVKFRKIKREKNKKEQNKQMDEYAYEYETN